MGYCIFNKIILESSFFALRPFLPFIFDNLSQKISYYTMHVQDHKIWTLYYISASNITVGGWLMYYVIEDLAAQKLWHFITSGIYFHG